ncbi:small ribosomal subunit protein mS37 [Heteronotia binoei]|uniref:small ribosomal subunit protein mS37 n=1 Tax=Heteronotia binoei TaxID=13085 RepID=UPI0029313605|nr:small ribosomal subunit protein mS37 [Heteronotia binoei]
MGSWSSPSYPAWVARLAQAKRRGGKPPPMRPSRPLVLADHVSNRRRSLGEATCITEMSLMMACWKQNEFSDVTCSREIQAFLDCASKAEGERKAKLLQESLDRSGTLGAKQINRLLHRFPNITDYH